MFDPRHRIISFFKKIISHYFHLFTAAVFFQFFILIGGAHFQGFHSVCAFFNDTSNTLNLHTPGITYIPMYSPRRKSLHPNPRAIPSGVGGAFIIIYLLAVVIYFKFFLLFFLCTTISQYSTQSCVSVSCISNCGTHYIDFLYLVANITHVSPRTDQKY